MKIIFGIIGALLLILVFVATYSVVSTLKSHPSSTIAGFTNQPITVGTSGGFHLLTDMQLLQHDQYDTVAIYTRLNRSSVVENIQTPLIELTPSGTTGVHITLSDTSVQTGLPTDIMDRLSHQTFTDGVVQDIALANPRDLDTQEVIVSFTKPTHYRLVADPQDTGIIYLDVLK